MACARGQGSRGRQFRFGFGAARLPAHGRAASVRTPQRRSTGAPDSRPHAEVNRGAWRVYFRTTATGRKPIVAYIVFGVSVASAMIAMGPAPARRASATVWWMSAVARPRWRYAASDEQVLYLADAVGVLPRREEGAWLAVDEGEPVAERRDLRRGSRRSSPSPTCGQRPRPRRAARSAQSRRFKRA